MIRLFGVLEVEDGTRTLGARDLGGARPKQVLEILLAARGHRVSTDRLADLRHRLSSTLSEALLAQCRAEGAQAYRVLVAASVLDQPFEPELLAALLHADATELTEELERLCERRILRVDGFRFRFRYDLVRQVLLTSLSPARRRLLQASLDQPSNAGALIPLAQASHSVGS